MKKNVFIVKAKLKHGDKYDYSLVIDNNIKNKFKILCNRHGIFEQRGDAHLSGQGCGKCANSVLSNLEEFKIKANNMHDNTYDYSLVNYVNSKTNVKIICKNHGIFEQTPDNHLVGHGCNKCSVEINSKKLINFDVNNFIEKANQIHDNKYDYSEIDYINARTKIKIICPKHGEFYQTTNDHLNGKGCLYCSLQETKPEKEIKEFLRDNNIDYIENDRTILNGKELDIYLPHHKLAIEFNGLYWHSSSFKKNNYHLNKTEECEKNGVYLIQIFEDEWINKKNIIKSIIKSKLNIYDDKMYARKCIIKEIDSKNCSKFLIENHVQGNVNAKIKIGLFYNDELVSVMTFGHKRVSMGNKINSDDEYEMLRFCNKINIQIIGGASKLFKYFIRNYNPKTILTFADRRYSQGILYDKLGFTFIENTKPNYFYFLKNEIKREYRFKFRKDILVKMGYDSNKTEHQIMDERGYYRIYDCGHKKYLFISYF